MRRHGVFESYRRLRDRLADRDGGLVALGEGVFFDVLFFPLSLTRFADFAGFELFAAAARFLRSFRALGNFFAGALFGFDLFEGTSM